MARRLLAPLLALTLTAAWLALLAPAAHAACHIAGFVESDVEAAESSGAVSLVVELQGRVGSCAGTVDVATVDGTAVAGEDYESVTQTLTFEEDDDRVETVDVTILADDVEDGGETFTLELSNPTGGISQTAGPATVTITEDGGSDDAATDGAAATDDAAAEDAAEEDAAAEDDAAVDVDDGTAVDTEEEAAEDGDNNLGIILAVVAAIVIGIGAFVVLRGRGE